MGKGGSFDFRELGKLQKQLERLEREQDAFCQECARELAARFLEKVKRRTPVDSGNLRRNWTMGEIRKNGGNYVIEIINETEYASCVEYGHRTPGHKGWVPGKFMMTLSEKEINAQAPAILEKKLAAYLKGVLNA